MAKIWAAPGKKVPAPPNPLKLIGSAAPEDKHENDVVTLCYYNKQLISGADDGKIKASFSKIFTCFFLVSGFVN